MGKNKITIAIDGPAAAGKSTVAKMIAEKLKVVYIDTGAMYRALTLKALRENVDVNDETTLLTLLQATNILLSQTGTGQVVLLDNVDVSQDIRKPDVTNQVSFIAQHESIRQEMVSRQQKLATNVGVVMDGRDIGTHVLPDADVKIFLLASAKERAERRHKENLEKGFTSDMTELIKEIEERDVRDSTRKSSPLIKADDAKEIDTTSLSIEQVVDEILLEVSQLTN